MNAGSPRSGAAPFRGEPASPPGAGGSGRPPWFDTRLAPRDFERLKAIIEGYAGIRMPDAKGMMLESRLRPRLRDLGLPSFAEYTAMIAQLRPHDPEFIRFIDAVTTNKTDFFREPAHFDYLVRTAWPNLAREVGAGVERELSVWCAASSTGEEPYTLAMVLSEAAALSPGLRFRIYATDLCSEVLDRARRGVYAQAQIAPVPPALRHKYLMQSRDPALDLVRIAPRLRGLVRFARVNLVEDDWGIEGPLDVVFCRNVFIYFDRRTQESILQRFCDHLVPGGYVFLGHAEAINGLDAPLRAVAPTTYRTLGGG